MNDNNEPLTTSVTTKAPITNPQNEKQALKDYFEAISTYLIPEIQDLVNKETEGEEHLKGFAIPLALALFTLIDSVGFLVSNECNPSGQKHFKAFLADESYFPSYYSEGVRERIETIYRNGLVHSIFPKNGCGIGKYKQSSTLMIEKEDSLNLNVSVLATDVINAYTRVKKKVEDEECNSEFISGRLIQLRRIEKMNIDNYRNSTKKPI